MTKTALLFAPLVAVAMSACGTLNAPTSLAYEPDAFERLHAGLSDAEVQQIVGRPDTVTGADASGERLWIYERPNAWDQHAEWDVTVGADGEVKDVSEHHE